MVAFASFVCGLVYLISVNECARMDELSSNAAAAREQVAEAAVDTRAAVVLSLSAEESAVVECHAHCQAIAIQDIEVLRDQAARAVRTVSAFRQFREGSPMYSLEEAQEGDGVAIIDRGDGAVIDTVPDDLAARLSRS
jgi:hypothetical protein